MVASPPMRATRELGPALAVSVAVLAAALFFGGGFTARTLPWIGGAGGVLGAGVVATRGLPGGWTAVAPLAGLGLWCTLSIAWSAWPDRSWEYANRTLAFASFAAL